MKRQVSLVLLTMLITGITASAKFKEDETAYLDGKFRALQDQTTSLLTQMQALNAQVQQLKQNQEVVQAALIRQQRLLQDMTQMVMSARTGGDENFDKLKATMAQFQRETQTSLRKLTGESVTASTPEPAAPARPATTTPAQPASITGYVTSAEGKTVSLDIGTEKGLRAGSRLAIYKSNDQNTQVGVLEVTSAEVGKATATVVQMNPGTKPDFSDIVRPQ